MMADDVLPVPPGGGPGQQEYDRQVTENVMAGDQAGLARLKGFAGGIGIGAARSPDDATEVTFAYTSLTDTGVLYFGDGGNTSVEAGSQTTTHTYPGAGFWGAVLTSGGRHGVCVVETGEPPVQAMAAASKKKK